MPDTPTETPRRVPLSAGRMWEDMHAERMANANKPGREERPSFVLKRSTASGSLGVVSIDVTVPVCEEFPTADAAIEAARRFMDDLCAAYPLPSGDVRAK